MAVSTILYIILIGVIALVAAILFYFYKPERSKKLRLILSSLRFITLFSVLLLLLNPEFKQVTYTTVKPKLALAIDNSNSIEYLGFSKDVNATAQKLLNNNKLSKRFDIDQYTFGTDIKSLDSINFIEEQTNISSALSTLHKIYKDQTYTPLLITDGNANLGSNYRYISTDVKNTAINFLVVGDTTQYEDLKIIRTNVNKYAYLDNEFPVEIITEYQGNNETNALLTITRNGTVVFKESKQFSALQTTNRFNFFLKASAIGVQNYTATISTLSNEKNTENNTKNFAVDVIDQRSKVLIAYSVLHPDLGTLRKSIESNQLRSVELKEVKAVTPIDINESDLIILFEPDTKFNSIYTELDKLNKNRFTITGTATNRNFTNSSQESFTLPVNNQTEESQPLINKSFTSFQLEDLDFTDYPPVKTQFGSSKIAGNGDVLFYQRVNGVSTKNPLLAITEIDGRREVILFGTGIFQWRIQSFLNNSSFENFDILIDKLVQYAVSNQKRSRLTVAYERIYYGGSSIKISARYFDQNYVFDPGANLQIKIQNKNSTYNYESPLVIKGNDYQVNLTNLEAGEYIFSISELTSGIKSSGAFTLIPYNLERQNLNADFAKMSTVATETNGRINTLNNIDQLVDQLINDDRYIPIQRAVKKSVPLVNFIYLLALIIISLTTEWFLRKYNGLI
ncbi:VWA domain-containing protein [Leeuwenhoekiella sp. NPDC079379]|uniref:VWA domain-containing protein n=1 Tax=Leeuwenhoekiella sp. NPDC079379 TaxID=3364122 RepID=UPI0037C8B961